MARYIDNLDISMVLYIQYIESVCCTSECLCTVDTVGTLSLANPNIMILGDLPQQGQGKSQQQ